MVFFHIFTCTFDVVSLCYYSTGCGQKEHYFYKSGSKLKFYNILLLVQVVVIRIK